MADYVEVTAAALSEGLCAGWVSAGEPVCGRVLEVRRVGVALAEITLLCHRVRGVRVYRLDADYPVRVFAKFLGADGAQRGVSAGVLERMLRRKLEGNRWGFGGLPVE